MNYEQYIMIDSWLFSVRRCFAKIFSILFFTVVHTQYVAGIIATFWPLMWHNIKVCPHYAARQNDTKCGFAMLQMVRIMWTLMRHGLGRASACHSMSCSMKIRSAKCRSHERFAAWHMMSKGFQNCISQLEKKTRWSSLVSFHSFCNPTYSLRKKFSIILL